MDDGNDHKRHHCCFQEWMHLQEADLDELLRAKAVAAASSTGSTAELRALVAKNVRHYQDYTERRRVLAREDPPSFFSPKWCSCFENSFLWMAGCRPSLAIHLLYTLTGAEMESHLDEFLRGLTTDVGELSAGQLALVNDLHLRTMREEETLGSRMASLQEEMADKPLVPLARNRGEVSLGAVQGAMDGYEGFLAGILEDADALRIKTLKEILGILSPTQAVDYLAAAKQLHLAVHEWGSQRESTRGSI
ncbi:hypothetical protein Taro_030589 [Colocasia esculenta]|uniref:DOG1 domain-containing protein n=1 Tax=Colocasia esculenta TaxID=4460 RepID=A0A843VSA9_COLES|nr:hypothetical protein [Colocasia esculenta]